MQVAIQKPLRKDIVQKKVMKMISDLNLQPGDRLLSEKKLADKFGVNHQTLRAAFTELSSHGILERRPGSGTFIKKSSGKQKKKVNFQYDSTKTVIVVMRNDPHFFSGLQNKIALKIEQDGMLPINVGSAPVFSTECAEQLLKLNSMGATQLVIDQKFVQENRESMKFLREHEAKFDKVVMILGNQVAHTGFSGSMVMGDYPEACNTAIAKLKSYGHQKIGYLCGEMTKDNLDWFSNRRHGELFSKAMLNNGLGEGIHIRTAKNDDEAKIKAKELIDEGCTAITTDNDYRAVLALETAKKMGLKIPEEFNVIGFMDTPWALHYNMTTFRYRNEEIADNIVRCLNDHNAEASIKLTKIDLIERGTTGMLK